MSHFLTQHILSIVNYSFSGDTAQKHFQLILQPFSKTRWNVCSFWSQNGYNCVKTCAYDILRYVESAGKKDKCAAMIIKIVDFYSHKIFLLFGIIKKHVLKLIQVWWTDWESFRFHSSWNSFCVASNFRRHQRPFFWKCGFFISRQSP